jgi:hypothetical protein
MMARKKEMTMKKQNNYSTKDIAFYMMLAIVVAMCFYVVIKVKDGSVKCMANPLQYGVKNLGTSDKSEITCMCSSPTSKQVLIVTEDNVTQVDKFTLFTQSP